MELPSFRNPNAKVVAQSVLGRTSEFVKKVFTILLVGAILMWGLSAFPWGAEPGDSYAAVIGKSIQPIFAPLGFDWRASVGILSGFMAKEIVVQTLGILYAVEGQAATQEAIAASMTPFIGYAFMAFSLLYVPCLASIATLRKESGSWKWTLFAVIYSILVAYLVAAAIAGVGSVIEVI
jgi:ferrous iron transport protein B